MADEKRHDAGRESDDRPQELPEREAHKLNHGDKLEGLIPRGGPDREPARADGAGGAEGEGGAR